MFNEEKLNGCMKHTFVISACCVLHNMCEIHGDAFNDSWLQQDSTHNSQYLQPPTTVHHGGTSNRPKEIVTYFST